MSSPITRGWVGGALVLFLAASAAYSSNLWRLREHVPPPARTAGAAPVDRSGEAVAVEGPSLRSQPWWQEVASFAGTVSTRTDSFEVVPHAIQWRASWSCDEGELTLLPIAADDGETGHRLADEAACPGEGSSLSVATGSFALDVRADGPWEVTIEQQLDVPLIEPPSAAMRSGTMVAAGRLYEVERTGWGEAMLYRTSEGGMELRLEDLYVSPNIDLEVRATTLTSVESADQFSAAPSRRLAMLPITTGSLNLELDQPLDLERWRSIVIWCEPLAIAYAAAPLDSRQ